MLPPLENPTGVPPPELIRVTCPESLTLKSAESNDATPFVLVDAFGAPV